MRLHAASGNDGTQAQSGGITITAAKAIDIKAPPANITISAPSGLMLNGESGGYIKINGGDIEIGTSGAAVLKASMKRLAGASASAQWPGFEEGRSHSWLPSATGDSTAQGASAL